MGQADAPARGDLLADGLHHHALEGVRALAAAQVHVLGGLAHHGGDELGLEALGGGVDLGLHRGALLGRHGGGAGLGGGQGRTELAGHGRDLGHGREGHGRRIGVHRTYSTWMSAWSAPAALMVCRIEIMSRGVTPRALRPATRVDSDGAPPTTSNCLPFSSSTLTADWEVTVVRPWLKGAGWLTWGVSCTEMVRLPWAMATWEMRTSEPITITPETSSITTRATLSGSTSSCSMAVM